MSGPRTVRLTGGFPKEPEHGNWDELSSLPGPPRLVEALFHEILGVEVTTDKCRKLAEPEPEDAAGDAGIGGLGRGRPDRRGASQMFEHGLR